MTTRRSIACRSLGLASALLLGVSAVAAAQRPSAPPTPPSHPAPAPQAAPQATQHPTAPPTPNMGEVKSFTGVARLLGKTPEALDADYQAALANNANLTHGQFVAANILAKNLGTTDPSITTDAILQGLVDGKSIGQTLQDLGLSAAEAQKAEAEANRQARGGKS